jgi:ADP-ribose pyrophosphatase YjhB (NUDIX family)
VYDISMPYVGSYIWKLRQKIGADLLIMPATEIVARRDDKLLMVYSCDFDSWVFPGGYVEVDRTWRESAAHELLEEGGLTVDPHDLKLFALTSGQDWRINYPNGDQVHVFINCLTVDKIINETDDFDEAEISKKHWFTVDEIEQLRLTGQERATFAAYKRYLETGELQMIEAAL